MKNLIASVILTIILITGADAEELTREFCRKTTDENLIIQCIQQNIWDPCEEGTRGSPGFWSAQCGWAHNTIAENEIKKAVEQIKERLRGSPEKAKALKSFLLAEKQWNKYRENYCRFSNAVNDYEGFTEDSSNHLAYCLCRLAEQHNEELNSLLNSR